MSSRLIALAILALAVVGCEPTRQRLGPSTKPAVPNPAYKTERKPAAPSTNSVSAFKERSDEAQAAYEAWLRKIAIEAESTTARRLANERSATMQPENRANPTINYLKAEEYEYARTKYLRRNGIEPGGTAGPVPDEITYNWWLQELPVAERVKAKRWGDAVLLYDNLGYDLESAMYQADQIVGVPALRHGDPPMPPDVFKKKAYRSRR